MSPLSNITLQKKWILFPILFLYLLITIISAWLCDDAFITFRTVDNFINGYGLTWNVNERVQAYTHPLWMFLISLFYFLTGEPYFTTLALSVILSLIGVLILVFKISLNLMNSLLVLTALIFSKAFVDYSTSGLENPLTYFLVIIFFFIYLKKKNSNQKILLLSLITSTTALNRYDIILLLLPPLLYYAYKTEKLKSIRYIIAGFIPLIAWLLFSLFYYGFPFPNTAYAKLNHGINSYELIEQGLYYFLNSFYLDPVTITLIFTCLALLFFLKMKSHYPAAIGIILYLIYIISVGGDFMSGRFLSVPFLIAVIIISLLEFKRSLYVTGLIFIVFLGLLAPYPTIFSSSTYGLGPKLIKGFRLGPTILITYDNGIADERLFYYKFTGLLNYQKLEKHQWVEKALKVKVSKKTPGIYNIAGIFGFYAGPDIHIIDPWALGDPLLSKLPSTEYWRVGSSQQVGDKWWRIGHFTRKIPPGYIESVKSGINVIEDESLRKYYDKLSFVIKGELFDSQRWAEIININLGKYDYLIEDYEKKLINDGKKISK